MQITSIDQRLKNISEQIFGNPTLREHLNDDQADLLFKWGIDRAEAFLRTLTSVSDQDAQSVIEKLTESLLRLFRCLNQLVYQLDHEIRDELSPVICDGFLQEADSLADLDEQAVMLLQTAVSHPADWSAESAFDFLYAILDSSQQLR